MDEHYEYAVIMPHRDLEPHRGPYATFAEALEWIADAFTDGCPHAFETWYVAERKVSGWYRVDG